MQRVFIKPSVRYRVDSINSIGYQMIRNSVNAQLIPQWHKAKHFAMHYEVWALPHWGSFENVVLKRLLG